jgi:hypothetical protein
MNRTQSKILRAIANSPWCVTNHTLHSGLGCVWLTTYHLQVPVSRNLEALTSQNPLSPIGL